MRERWFGATGRKVPEIVLEGTIDLEGALVVDDLSDHERDPRGSRRRARRSSCARRAPRRSCAALSHGEVACALVRDPKLLELEPGGADLRLTGGCRCRAASCRRRPGIVNQQRRRYPVKGLVALCVTMLLAIVVAIVAGGIAAGGGKASDFSHLYPDLRTVVPTHLAIANQQQRDILRFSNGIANTGHGPWAVRAEHELLDENQTTTAIQEIRTTNDRYECGSQPKQVSACYEIVAEQAASVFEYHPSHHHWHTAGAAGFEVQAGLSRGPGRGFGREGRLLPRRGVPAGRQLVDERAHVLGLLRHAPGRRRRLGRPVPPCDRRPAARPDGRGGRHVLPRLDRRPRATSSSSRTTGTTMRGSASSCRVSRRATARWP